jgi:GMP synthase-like glutamine amidotransferase
VRTVPILQHVPHETLGSLEVAFAQAGVAWRNVPLFSLASDGLPWLWDEVAGLVVLGGPMNVDQVSEYPFLQRELTWLREAIARDLPVLGICLGAQLLAKSLGARVFPNPVKEIGWYGVELVAPADDPLFGGLTRRHTVFQWHGDTFELPAGAVQLARSQQCEQQAFRYGTRAYGLQFHIEVTADMVDEWLSEAENEREINGLDYIDPALIRKRLPAAIRELEILGWHVLSRFAGMCRERGVKGGGVGL